MSHRSKDDFFILCKAWSVGKLHGSITAFTKQLIIIQNMPGRYELLLLTYFGYS